MREGCGIPPFFARLSPKSDWPPRKPVDHFSWVNLPIEETAPIPEMSLLPHDTANFMYIMSPIAKSRYFVGTILQFQIYRAMCVAARQYDPADPQKPLHKCDVYRQPEAGNVLRKLMEKGASQPWQRVLEEAIGEARLDGGALRDYFRPLEEWLRNENLRNQEFVGWNYDGDYCKKSIETANLQVYGGFYNEGDVIKNTTLLIVLCVCLLIVNTW